MNVFTAKKCNNCNYISESIKYLYKKIKRKICNAVFVFIIKYEAQADHLSYSLSIAPPIYCPVTMETLSSVSVERMKVQLLQKQSELTTTIQAFEEFKEVNKYVHVTSM